MSEMDDRLRELIAKICNNPKPLTELERRRLIDRLLVTVQKLSGVLKSSHPDFLEALDQTWWWLSRNICKFEPPNSPLPHEKGLTRWINGYLYRRIQDLYQQNSLSQYSLDQAISQDGEDSVTWLEQLSTTAPEQPTLSGLEAYIEKLQKEKNQEVFLRFELYIEHDPDQRLQDCHLRHFPNCNAQMLCKRVLLQNPSEKFSTLSREFEINYQTLKSHWEKKCKPLLQEILVELGYDSESFSA